MITRSFLHQIRSSVLEPFSKGILLLGTSVRPRAGKAFLTWHFSWLLCRGPLPFRVKFDQSAFLSVMRKFEKAPESQVILSANVTVGGGSKVPGSESPLLQCFIGKGWWGDGRMRKQALLTLACKSNKTIGTIMKNYTLSEHVVNQLIPKMYIQLVTSLQSL